MTPAEPRTGYLYVLTNPSIPGQVKVGRTERNPQDRRKELSAATGVPTPFELVHGQFFEDCHAAEAVLHERWSQEGRRVSAQREFFRMESSDAIRAIEAFALEQQAASRRLAGDDSASTEPTHGKAVIKGLLDQGFRWYRGDAATLRNDTRALEHFEQAASMGSTVGAYWAGRTCERLSEAVRRKLDQREWQQRALVHLQAAVYKGHIKACARASWLFRAVDQHDEADALWMEFLHRQARGKMDDESARWIVRWAIGQSGQGRMLPDSKLWAAHGEALLAACPPDIPTGARRALRRKIWPWWKRTLVGAGVETAVLVIALILGIFLDVRVGVAMAMLVVVAIWVRRRWGQPAVMRSTPKRRR